MQIKEDHQQLMIHFTKDHKIIFKKIQNPLNILLEGNQSYSNGYNILNNFILLHSHYKTVNFRTLNIGNLSNKKLTISGRFGNVEINAIIGATDSLKFTTYRASNNSVACNIKITEEN